MADKPVYSSLKGDLRQTKEKASRYEKAAGPAKMRLETGGRAGKAVTVLYHLPLTEAEARSMMKELQSILGVGATLKDSRIELQGDQRERVAEYFAKRGLKIRA